MDMINNINTKQELMMQMLNYLMNNSPNLV
jgi:hypothetical protein